MGDTSSEPRDGRIYGEGNDFGKAKFSMVGRDAPLFSHGTPAVVPTLRWVFGVWQMTAILV